MLTVLIATRNGERTLPQVLEAFERLQSPPSGWKLVIVDNGSTDQTHNILMSFRGRLPLTYRWEKEPGKNAALNSGLDCVEGDLVVFTDDDVFPDPNWLIRMKAGADAHPNYSILGGRVKPRWAIPAPEWMAWVPLGPVFTITSPYTAEGPITPGLIYGPNMAIRTKVFETGIRFDTSIGPRGANYAMGSETELVQRLFRQGHTAWHVNDAVVEHFIRDFQIQKRWVLQRAVRFGRGQYRLSQSDPAGRTWFGMPPWLLRQTCISGLRALKGALSFDAERSFRTRWDFHYMRGQLTESRILCQEFLQEKKRQKRNHIEVKGTESDHVH